MGRNQLKSPMTRTPTNLIRRTQLLRRFFPIGYGANKPLFIIILSNTRALGARVPHTQAEARRRQGRTEIQNPRTFWNRGKISLCVAGADRNRLLRRPVPPPVAQTRGSENLKKSTLSKRAAEAHANARLSAHVLSGGLCVPSANQNRLLRLLVPPSVAQTRGSESLQTHVSPRREKGKPMQMYALSAHALGGHAGTSVSQART